MEETEEGEKPMTVRWGVIGCGRLPNTFTIPYGLMEARNAQLVGVTDVVAPRAQETAERFEVRAYADADELLADPHIDAVYVATPTVSHAELTITAARRGKHVLCEKPLGLDPAEAAEMVRVCDEAGVTLGHGTMMRYNAIHEAMRKMVGEGAIGRPVAMHALFSDLWPTDLEHLSSPAGEVWGLSEERAITWRQRKQLGGGGPMADLGIHVIDTMVFIMGRVREAASFCDTLTSRLDVEDTASVLLKFENGAQATIECYSSTAKFEGAQEPEGIRDEGVAAGVRVARPADDQGPSPPLRRPRRPLRGGSADGDRRSPCQHVRDADQALLGVRGGRGALCHIGPGGPAHRPRAGCRLPLVEGAALRDAGRKR